MMPMSEELRRSLQDMVAIACGHHPGGNVNPKTSPIYRNPTVEEMARDASNTAARALEIARTAAGWAAVTSLGAGLEFLVICALILWR